MFLKTTDPATRKTCPRCGGKGNVGGVVVYAGERGGCFQCAGYGVLPTAEELRMAMRRNKAKHIVEVEDIIDALRRAPAPRWGKDKRAKEIADREAQRLVLIEDLKKT